MSLPESYATLIPSLLDRLVTQNRESLETAASLLADTVAHGGIIHTFGSGHSGIIALEMVHRAGGLVPVSQIIDPTGGAMEDIAGFGERLLSKYELQYGLRPGECIIVISNSGKNASPVEIALAAKNRGLSVIGLSSLPMSKQSQSQHPGGKRLFEIADVMLDNGGAYGDTALEIPALGQHTGPTSTITGAFLLNLLSLHTIEKLIARGHEPPLLKSINVPGGREHNARFAKTYGPRLSRPV